MQKIKFYIAAVLLFFSIASCTKNFEDEPREFVTEDYIWSEVDPTGTYAQNFIANIYSQLPFGYNRVNGVSLDCLTDDAVPSNDASATWNFIRSGYSPFVTFDDNWTNSYAGIRKANIFLANYKRIPWADPVRPRWFSAEARFLRSFFYYEMIKRYGGVPLIGDKVLTLQDDISFPRNSFDECVTYMVSELDAIKDSLRSENNLTDRANQTDPDGGRATKGAVLALKAKVLLLAASPLYNTTNDLNKWKTAAEAAKAVMDMNNYMLEPNRYTLYTNRVNRENIFYRQNGGNGNGYVFTVAPVGYRPNNTSSQGLISPTQELVDAFPMKNGLAINATGSGYSAANPYANRDPRLDQTIFYNGLMWLKRPVETFEGGLDKPNSATQTVQTKTGYYSKKFVANDANSTAYSNVTSTWTFIRYADILLAYAEAQNEFAGPSTEVYNAVQLVRQRAGLVPFALAAGLTKDQVRTIIRNERRVEFAFEEQRFYDIRRWKIAEAVYGTTLHGVKIIKNANGSFTYSPIDVVRPFFSSAMYKLPISNNEILKNRNLIQNEGY